jgi:SAM-dependent methyltransferase
MTKGDIRDHLREQAYDRLYPSLTNPNYLVLSKRREVFSRWIRSRNPHGLSVLDVGGRIQPYRTLLEGRIQRYIALDIVCSPLVDVRGSAEALPLQSESFDLVICTQVFEYFADPCLAASEIHRVLKPTGFALMSFASFYPRAAEEERWRFLPNGLQHVLRPFRKVEIVPEGSSISGFNRACAVCIAMFAKFSLFRTLACWTVVPCLNISAKLLDRLELTDNDQASGNYSVLAEK